MTNPDRDPGGVRPTAAGVDFHASFNFEGHRVIALAMMTDLAVLSPRAHARVEEILRKGGRTAVEAATFPDEIRNQQPQTKPFHFINLRFVEGDSAEPSLPDPPHVLAQIVAFTTVLAAARTSDRDRVDALSWLIHMFGDVHQPMHCISRVSALHPNGDLGGNLFALGGGAGNLHSLWDSSLDPFSGSGEEQIATAILAQHPRATLTELAETDREKWARATHRIARTFAYSLVEKPSKPPTPSNQYRKTMERHGRRQAALAVYRLSNHLRDTLA